jgi:hypothetical protein
VANGRHPRLCITGRLEALNLRQHGSEHRVGFELSECPSDAHVYARTPADLTANIAADVESVGVGPLARVAVGSREQQAAHLRLSSNAIRVIDGFCLNP